MAHILELDGGTLKSVFEAFKKELQGSNTESARKQQVYDAYELFMTQKKCELLGTLPPAFTGILLKDDKTIEFYKDGKKRDPEKSTKAAADVGEAAPPSPASTRTPPPVAPRPPKSISPNPVTLAETIPYVNEGDKGGWKASSIPSSPLLFKNISFGMVGTNLEQDRVKKGLAQTLGNHVEIGKSTPVYLDEFYAKYPIISGILASKPPVLSNSVLDSETRTLLTERGYGKFADQYQTILEECAKVAAVVNPTVESLRRSGTSLQEKLTAFATQVGPEVLSHLEYDLAKTIQTQYQLGDKGLCVVFDEQQLDKRNKTIATHLKEKYPDDSGRSSPIQPESGGFLGKLASIASAFRAGRPWMIW